METSNTGEVVGLRIFGGKIAPVGGVRLPISHFKKMGDKSLFFTPLEIMPRCSALG